MSQVDQQFVIKVEAIKAPSAPSISLKDLAMPIAIISALAIGAALLLSGKKK